MVKLKQLVSLFRFVQRLYPISIWNEIKHLQLRKLELQERKLQDPRRLSLSRLFHLGTREAIQQGNTGAVEYAQVYSTRCSHCLGCLLQTSPSSVQRPRLKAKERQRQHLPSWRRLLACMQPRWPRILPRFGHAATFVKKNMSTQ